MNKYYHVMLACAVGFAWGLILPTPDQMMGWWGIGSYVVGYTAAALVEIVREVNHG